MSTDFAFDLIFTMSMLIFTLGICSTITGVVILAARAAGREVQTLAAQATRLAQKGMAEDVAGLVGNASSLLDAVNQLIRTTAGVGVFLTIFGLLLMIAACLLALKIY
jgi:hypothetical protein